MTQTIAVIALMILGSFNALGNFWFTYGIWPKSWSAFAFFWLSGMVLYFSLNAVVKAERPKK